MGPAGFNLAVLVTEKGASQATGGGHISEVTEKRNSFKKNSYEIFIYFVEMFQGCVCKLCVTKCHRICPMSGTKHTLIEISPTEKEGETNI